MKITAIIEKTDVDNITVKDQSYPVLIGFNPLIVAGSAVVKKKNGVIIAEMLLLPDCPKGIFYPAIGFRVDSKKVDEVGSVTFTSGELLSVGLSEIKNVDETIEPILIQ